MTVFDKRIIYKPYEYPDAMGYADAINKSYWLVSEVAFTSDIDDFYTKINDEQRNSVKNAILAISQIEVSVKKFWAKIGEKFPKSEFEQVGYTFAESEVRHARAYSQLLEVLGLNEEYNNLLNNPVIQGRIDYLTKYLKGASENNNEKYTLTLTLFSIFIENVSLFSQFLIIKSFKQHLNLFKDLDTVIKWTQQEETIHALFGVYLIKKIKEEFPDWFNEDFYNKLYRACKKAYDAELKIIDWIMPEDLEFLSKETVIEFVKDRFNQSIEMIGGEPVFDIDKEKLGKSMFFYEELYGKIGTDFFNTRSTEYSKFSQPITEESLFDD